MKLNSQTLVTTSELYIITLKITLRLVRSKQYRCCVVLVHSRDFGSHRRLLDQPWTTIIPERWLALARNIPVFLTLHIGQTLSFSTLTSATRPRCRDPLFSASLLSVKEWSIYSLNGSAMLRSYNGSFLRKCLFPEFVSLSHFLSLSVPVLLSLTAFRGRTKCLYLTIKKHLVMPQLTIQTK